MVTTLTQQIFHGDVTNITAMGDKIALQVNVKRGDTASLIDVLTEKGIPKSDAVELAEIAQKNPEKLDESGIKNWIQGKLKQGALEAWGMGKDVAKAIVTHALKGFFGL